MSKLPSVRFPRANSHVPAPTTTSTAPRPIEDRGVECLKPGQGHLRGNRRQRLTPEARRLPLLQLVCLHEQDGGEVLFDRRADRPIAAALLARHLTDAVGKESRRQPEEGRDGDRQQSEPPTEEEERPGEEGDPQQVGETIGSAGDEHRLDLLGIVGQALDEIAPPLSREKIGRQALHVGDETGAQVEQEALAEPGREGVVGEGDNPGEQRQHEIGEGDARKRAEIP